MIRSVKILISLLLVFALHRLLAWPHLSGLSGEPSTIAWRDAVTGLLSDVWIASLLTLPFWAFEFFSNRRIRVTQRIIAPIWVLAWGLLTAAHQNYVEFFKFQILPFHVSYLVDDSFILANSWSLLNPSSSVIAGLALGLAYWTYSAKRNKRRLKTLSMLIVMLILSLTAHTFNIRWRVNWFVIEPLQNNYIEALYSNYSNKPQLKSLSESERQKFQNVTKQENALAATANGNPDPFVAAIKSEVNRVIKSKSPVIIGIILAESLREADTGPRSSDHLSLTPALDQLQERGVKFTNFYSSGPVTRGGQEAAWCGTPSATNTSLMRSFPDANINCLPALVRNRSDVKALWLHGGDRRFDSQLLFWTHQGVSRFLTQDDFPPNTPATGWGVSDLALFDQSLLILEGAAKETGIKVLLPMILTVTNHIPWTIPRDATLDTRNFIASHSSFRTVKYFDESLDLFIRGLKERNLWQHSIFVIAGDHGNLEPSWTNPYGSDPHRSHRLLSHVSLTLTGGLVERLRSEGKVPPRIDHHTAQSQIAPFIAEVIDLKLEKGMPDRPMFEVSPWPVTSDLNQFLFLPGVGDALPKESVLSGNIEPSKVEPWKAATRYRWWLEFLYQGHSAN
jgi:phosphoglycerol transferase MdoB-like AlkP superfamily enzyme